MIYIIHKKLLQTERIVVDFESMFQMVMAASHAVIFQELPYKAVEWCSTALLKKSLIWFKNDKNALM